jgi:cephalosporin-C deacetylase-like acetyl esterase
MNRARAGRGLVLLVMTVCCATTGAAAAGKPKLSLDKVPVCLHFGSNARLADETTVKMRETLPALNDGVAPRTLDEMWAGFDPCKEPLDVEVLKQWEDDGVTLKVLRYRIATFKGQKAMLAAVYGYPSSGKNLPGLVQIHGGGQYADHRACLLNAKRGYATISIAWAGRISAPDYRVTPNEVKLFWEGKVDDPAYKVTTDWGAVDGYHAPGRNPGNVFPSAKPAAWTLDEVESPRNSGWFPCAVAARRALTFLQQQPEVDPDRLGVYGHSMGGKLTVMTAVDPRVKAAAPSCGGISDRHNNSAIYRATLGDDVSLKAISCPIIFLSPANDFHGRVGDLPKAIAEIRTDHWRVTCAPHHNHQDTPQYEVATMLWMDQHLRDSFSFPQTPETTLSLKTDDGVPSFRVQPSRSRPVLSVDVFYTQHGKADERSEDMQNTMNRFWHHAEAEDSGGGWTAKLPLGNVERPLCVYANVTYSLDAPVSAAGYYYGTYMADTLNLSSLLQVATSDELETAEVRATLEPSLVIEDFEGDWQKEWFTYKPAEWPRATHKVYDDTWKAPEKAKLALKVRAAEANKLVVMIDGHAAEVEMTGGPQWQDVLLVPNDFRNSTGEPLPSWENIKELKLGHAEWLRPKRGERTEPRMVGESWRGPKPEFRELRWRLTSASSESAQSLILDVFPQSVAQVPADRRGQTAFSTRFTPSGSLWDERLDEKRVFQLEMAHAQDVEKSFKLRMGKGGQIYSLRGAFGESVPPSWRAEGGHLSPWNDEVWQFVAVCTTYNGVGAAVKAGGLPDDTIERMKKSPYRSSFFVHNSGAYIPNNTGADSLYCPLLAFEVRPEDCCCRMLNWGLVPQLKTVHRSPLLYYTQVRDVGEGIIELTWIVHNFSVRDDVVFDHMNAPWGGTRVTSLPLRYVSSPEGKLVERQDILNASGVVPVRETGGWNLSCTAEADDSPSLALVYGRDRHLSAERARKAAGEPFCQFNHSLYRDWRASAPSYERAWKDWRSRPANSFRNYDVCEVIPKVRISPGTTIWYRSFLVVGRRNKVVKLAQSLVDKVDYGLLTFDLRTTPMREVLIPAGSVEVSDKRLTPKANFELFVRPVSGSRPLFLIQHERTGRRTITTDPYYLVTKEKLDFGVPTEHPHHDYYSSIYGYSMDESNTSWQSLLGYGYANKPETGRWRQLSALVDPSMFPEPDRYHLDLWVKDTESQ